MYKPVIFPGKGRGWRQVKTLTTQLEVAPYPGLELVIEDRPWVIDRVSHELRTSFVVIHVRPALEERYSNL